MMYINKIESNEFLEEMNRILKDEAPFYALLLPPAMNKFAERFEFERDFYEGILSDIEVSILPEFLYVPEYNWVLKADIETFFETNIEAAYIEFDYSIRNFRITIIE